MLLKLKYIIQGWFHLILSKFKELKYSKLYKSRLDICNSCDKNKNGICDVCGCYLKAKTKSDSLCPIGKW